MITHIVSDWLFSPCCVEHQDEFIFERVAVAYSRDYYEVERAQIKMISCTHSLHDFLEIHEDHTAIVRSPHGLRTRAERASCDIRAIFMYGCGDSTMTARSPYDLRSFCLRLCTDRRNPSKKSHDGRINVNT